MTAKKSRWKVSLFTISVTLGKTSLLGKTWFVPNKLLACLTINTFNTFQKLSLFSAALMRKLKYGKSRVNSMGPHNKV